MRRHKALLLRTESFPMRSFLRPLAAALLCAATATAALADPAPAPTPDRR